MISDDWTEEKGIKQRRRKITFILSTIDFIKNFIGSYKCIPKAKYALLYTEDPLLSLVNCYDCSKVEIGCISFLESPIEEIGFYQVGNVDADILAINKITFKVEVLDYTSKNHVIWECAVNSDNFLNALLLCAEILTARLKNLSEDDPLISEEDINHCANTAGGEEYTDFYQMLIG